MNTWSNKPHKVSFETPEDMWDAAVAYFEWASTNPIIKTTDKGDKIEKARAFTVHGFCLHAGLVAKSYYNYKNKYDEFQGTIDSIEAVMYEQKFTHAVAGEMNANLISRELNLAEKREISGPGGAPIRGGITFEGVGPDDE